MNNLGPSTRNNAINAHNHEFGGKIAKATLQYNSRNGSELMVASVCRHVQHQALIKDNFQINKIISILYHSYCENLTWYWEREICTQWQRFWMDLIEIEMVNILNNFLKKQKKKTLFHTNIRCKIRIFSQHNNIKQRYISQRIIENILVAVYLSVLLLK